jgi:hypothetical protein
VYSMFLRLVLGRRPLRSAVDVVATFETKDARRLIAEAKSPSRPASYGLFVCGKLPLSKPS